MEDGIVEVGIIVGVEVGTTVLTIPVEVREAEIVRKVVEATSVDEVESITKVTFIH